jgi:CheY-like chemotaxis protein
MYNSQATVASNAAEFKSDHLFVTTHKLGRASRSVKCSSAAIFMGVVSECVEMIKDHSSYTTIECQPLPTELDCDTDADCNTLLRGLYLTAAYLISCNEHHSAVSSLKVSFQPGNNNLPVIVFALDTHHRSSVGTRCADLMLNDNHARFTHKSEWKLAARLLKRCSAVPVILHRDAHHTICMIAFHRCERHPVIPPIKQDIQPARRLLLLEDDNFVGPMLVEQLTDAGYDVTLCGTVREAASAFAGASFSAALFDQHLPDGSGIELLQSLRERSINLPVVLLSGDMFSAELKRWLRNSNADAISKPFVIGRLLEKIEQLGTGNCSSQIARAM